MSPIHDLSYPISSGMSTYPAAYHPSVEVLQLGFLETHGRESRRITIGTHAGTHIDAASHFIRGGRTIDAVPLDDLAGPARVIRFPDSPPGTRITASDLVRHLGDDRPTRLLVRYDWSRRWGSTEFYRDYPFLTPEACEVLVSRGLRLFGSDSPSPDDPLQSGPSCDPDSPNHKLLLGTGVSLVEYLTGLDAIEADVVQLVALPLRVAGGDGSPARVIAIER